MVTDPLSTSMPFGSGQNLMLMMALANQGQGGYGNFDPTLFMDPRARMKLGVAQNMLQEGTSAGPLATPLAGLSRLGSAIIGAKMYNNVFPDQQQDPNAQKAAANAATTEHTNFAKMLGDPGSYARDWFDSLPEWRKTMTELNPPEWITSYIQRQKVGPTDTLKAPGAPDITSPQGPNDVSQAVYNYNQRLKQGASPGELATLQSNIGNLITKVPGWQIHYDPNTGEASYSQPMGPATPGYHGDVAGAEAQAGVGPAIETATNSPITIQTPGGPVVTTPHKMMTAPGTSSSSPPPPPPPPSPSPGHGSGLSVAPQKTQQQPGHYYSDSKAPGSPVYKVDAQGHRTIVGKIGADGKSLDVNP